MPVSTPEVTFLLEGRPVLNFHPVVDLSDGRLLGMEALVRWVHPNLGLIGPDRLLPMVEDNGDIVALNRWVLAEAAIQAQQWSPSVQLSVNCSLEQLRNSDMVDAASDVLAMSNIGPGRLTLEIHEDSVSDSVTVDHLRALSAMGFELAVDHVGASWLSFEPLSRLSVRTVKIDGSLVAGSGSADGMDRLVIEKTVDMAHSLGMATIVERVETVEQVKTVRSIGVDAAQGFFFSRPMLPEDASELATGSVSPKFSMIRPLTMAGSPAGARGADTADAEPVEPAGGAGTDDDSADSGSGDVAEGVDPAGPGTPALAGTTKRGPASRKSAKSAAARKPATPKRGPAKGTAPGS
jgi:EAL domain-containing protein (putative c-di-GMP-specific phosphodiesterase class I)